MSDWPLVHAASDGWERTGVVRSVSARSIEIVVPGLTPGACVLIERRDRSNVAAEVVAVTGDRATCAPLESPTGILVGARAASTLARVGAYVGESLLGRDADAWGRSERSRSARAVGVDPHPIPPAQRAPVSKALWTGVAAIDAFATIGYGQRIALFAGAGIGKTTLLRRIVERADVDARVVALVGERGREAAELLARFAHDERAATTTVICATAEAPPIQRLAAARTATAHAEALAAGGRNVLLVVDSLTRVATAWREHALASGESAVHRGHPPSLPSAIAGLVERAGARRSGSITAIYSVLVEGDDEREPVTDAVRALLDGHITLSRRLAEAGSFPAIDVLRSLSRLMHVVATPEHRADAALVRGAMSALEQAEDLFAIGAYRAGGDRRLDAAVRVRDDIGALVFDESIVASPRDPRESLAGIARSLRDEA
jgi:flagellum-specific ATP synthase